MQRVKEGEMSVKLVKTCFRCNGIPLPLCWRMCRYVASMKSEQEQFNYFLSFFDAIWFAFFSFACSCDFNEVPIIGDMSNNSRVNSVTATVV